MKVTAPRIIVIQEEGRKPIRFTDPRMAAEHWAQAKTDAWIEKNKENPKYKHAHPTGYHRPTIKYDLYGEGKARYRKMKRRALRIFRRVMNEQTDK